jgi:hypothetical protein
MLIVLYRRAPRTKSIHERTSHRYSLVDSTCSHDNQQELLTISNNKQDIYQNHLDLTDSILRQYNDVIISSNGQDDSTVSFSDDIDDDDSDEYAYFILCRPPFFLFLPSSFSLYNISSFLFCLDASCSSFIDLYHLGEKHELKVRLIIDKVCDEVHRRHFNQFQHFKKKNKKCKLIHFFFFSIIQF